MRDEVAATAPSVIRRMLDLSTGHVPPQWGNTTGGLPAAPGVLAENKDQGWFMWVPDDPVESDEAMEDRVPPEILNIQKFARRLNCDWVLFDSDGAINENLPHWEW